MDISTSMEIVILSIIVLLFLIGSASILYSIVYEEDPILLRHEDLELELQELEINDDILE